MKWVLWLQSMNEAGETRNGSVVIREHFPGATKLVPASLSDAWTFEAAESHDHPAYFEILSTSEDRHVAGHAFHADSYETALKYVTRYRNEVESECEQPEVCIVAAIRLPDGRIFRGQRHSDCIRIAHDLIEYRHRAGYEAHGWTSGMASDQGFVTSRNRYVGRVEGMQLQLAAGIESVAEGGYGGRLLFSEDLY